MLIVTSIIIGIAIIFSLTLAASGSSITSADAGDGPVEDEHIQPLNRVPKAFVTTHDGVENESRPLVSAAGLQ